MGYHTTVPKGSENLELDLTGPKTTSPGVTSTDNHRNGDSKTCIAPANIKNTVNGKPLFPCVGQSKTLADTSGSGNQIPASNTLTTRNQNLQNADARPPAGQSGREKVGGCSTVNNNTSGPSQTGFWNIYSNNNQKRTETQGNYGNNPRFGGPKQLQQHQPGFEQGLVSEPVFTTNCIIIWSL